MCSFFKCGAGTAYRIVSVCLKPTYFCTEGVCTKIDIYVPKWTVPIFCMYRSDCTDIDIQCTETGCTEKMYRKCMYRNCHVPKATYPEDTSSVCVIVVPDRRRNSCLSLMYDSLHGLAGISTSPFRRSYKHTRSADGDTFCVLSSQTNPYKYSLYPRTIADWNALPASVKSRPVMSFHSFVLLYHMFQLDQLHLTTLQSRQ